MARDGLSVCGPHRVGIAMVSGDHKEGAWASESGGGDPSKRSVDRFARAQCRLPVARVSNHVWIRQVRNDEMLFTAFNGSDHRIGNLSGPHLRSEIVGRNAWARDEEAALARECLLPPSVQKVGDMSVLLRLCNVKLPQPSVSNTLGERRHRRRAEDRRTPRLFAVRAHPEERYGELRWPRRSGEDVGA